MARKTSAGAGRAVVERCSSLANTLSSTSESERVLRWRRSSSIIVRESSSTFVRLPLWPRPMPKGAFT
jgi:hypothetical protein